MIFTQKADDNLVTVVKAVDEVQKNNKDLGTFVVGVSGVQEADFTKIQETHKPDDPADHRGRQGRPDEVRTEQGRRRDRARLQEGRQDHPELRVQDDEGSFGKGERDRRSRHHALK